MTDLTPEFTLSGPDLGTIALDPAQRPVKLDATTYRYFLTGTFANGDAAADDGLDDIVLTFLPNSFTGGGATTPAPVAYQNLHATNTRSYIDIRFDPTAAGRKAGTAPATLAGRIDADSILDPGDEFTLTGAAVSGFAFDATREVVAVGDGVYRYFFTATFGTGAVTVDFDGAEWETNAGTTGHGPDETFTVLGPTGTLGDPADQASTGPQNLNGRGYLDVGITAPAGKTLDLATVYDEAAEFALKGAGGTALAGLAARRRPDAAAAAQDREHVVLPLLDARHVHQRPHHDRLHARRLRLHRRHRHRRRGRHDPGRLHRRRRRHAEHRLARRDPGADVRPVELDDRDDHGRRGGVHALGHGRGHRGAARRGRADPPRDVGHVALLLHRRLPHRRRSTSRFGPDTFQSGAPGDSASNVGNLADTQTFFLESITAGLGDPSLGAIQGTDTLNRRGFFEVTFTKPAYATGLDVASVTDLAPEFTVTTPGVELDANRAPVLIDSTATTWTFRYFFNGPKNAAIAYDFIGGSVDFTDGQGAKVPLFAPRRVKVVRGDGGDADTDPDDLLIEVPFGELGSLDDATVASADLTAAFTGESATTTLTLVKLAESDSQAGVFRFEITSPPAGLTDGSEVVVNYTGDFTFGGVSRVLATGGSATPDPDGTFIEIHVDRVGDTALDPASLANADIALSGDGVTDAAGARTVVADPTRGPELLADGETVRYYLTGAFDEGPRPGRLGRRRLARHRGQRERGRQRQLPPDRGPGGVRRRGAREDLLHRHQRRPRAAPRRRVRREHPRDPRQGLAGDRQRHDRRPEGLPLQARRLRHDQGHQAREHRVGRRDVRPAEQRRALRPGVLGRRHLRHQPELPRAVRHLPPGLGAAAGQHDRHDQDRDALARGHPGRDGRSCSRSPARRRCRRAPSPRRRSTPPGSPSSRRRGRTATSTPTTPRAPTRSTPGRPTSSSPASPAST